MNAMISAQESNTLFMKACLKNDVQAALHHVAHGANVDVIDENGKHVLHWTAASEKNKGAKILNHFIGRVSDPQSTDHQGMTALHIAAWCSNIECVQSLIRAGFDVNALDSENRSPLALSAQNPKSDQRDATSLMLIAHGARPENGPFVFRSLSQGEAALLGDFHDRLSEIMKSPPQDRDHPEALASFAISKNNPKGSAMLAVVQSIHARIAIDELFHPPVSKP